MKRIDMCIFERVIVDVDKVLYLCKGFCEVDGCGKERGVVDWKFEGGVFVVSLCCEKGYKSVWYLLEVFVEKKGMKVLCKFYFDGSGSVGYWK